MAKVWNDGDPLSAQVLNRELRDEFNAPGELHTYRPYFIAAPNAASTPTPREESRWTPGSGAISGWYSLTGDLVRWGVRVEWGASSAFSTDGYWCIGRPFAEMRADSMQRFGEADIIEDWPTLTYQRLTFGESVGQVWNEGEATPRAWFPMPYIGDSWRWPGEYEAGPIGEGSVVASALVFIKPSGFSGYQSNTNWDPLGAVTAGSVIEVSGWYYRTHDALLEMI